MPTCIITGSTGFLGSRLALLFRANNWRVIETSRNLSHNPCDQIQLDLNNDDPILIPTGVDVLIHCAYDFKASDWQAIYRTNVERTVELFIKALSAGCKRCIFVSSMAAFYDAKSLYGKAKYEAELKLIPKGVISIRPGLIYGNQAKGIVGMMQKYISFLPVIPIIGDGSYILYLIHIDDLCQAIFELAVSAEVQPISPIVLANPEPISLKQLINTLENKNNNKVLTIPVAPPLIIVCLIIMERLGIRIGLRSDSVLSIINSNPYPWIKNPWQRRFRFRSLKDK